jgi:hypothetical protein
MKVLKRNKCNKKREKLNEEGERRGGREMLEDVPKSKRCDRRGPCGNLKGY